MCSGKVYFDLLEERDARGLEDIYLMRLEQYYPFPEFPLKSELQRFKNAEMVWCQEEPKNQGRVVLRRAQHRNRIDRHRRQTYTRPRYAGRAAAASPATGLASQHKEEQTALVNDALTI